MKKESKLILIFSIIGVIGIGAIIAMLIIMNNDTYDEDEDNSVSQSETAFIDEVINFGKAAETKYVADSLSSTSSESQVKCYNISDLQGTYVSNEDSNYSGKIVLTINDDTITKTITMTNKKYYVVDAVPSRNMDVHAYTSSRWNEIDSKCN